MAVAENVFAEFLKTVISPAVVLAAVALFVQPATAMVVSIGGTAATLECKNGITMPCAGFTSSEGNTNSSPTVAGSPDTTAPHTADVFSLASNNPVTEARGLNVLAGTTYATGTQFDTGGAESYSFSTDALYFMIKLGLGEVYFQNLTGGLLYLDFLANGTGGGGLNHVTAFGGTVAHAPLPAALPLFASALAVLGLFGWRWCKV